MAKVIKRLPNGALKVEYEESDPIYSEGWTIGPKTVSEEEEDSEEGEG